MWSVSAAKQQESNQIISHITYLSDLRERRPSPWGWEARQWPSYPHCDETLEHREKLSVSLRNPQKASYFSPHVVFVLLFSSSHRRGHVTNSVCAEWLSVGCLSLCMWVKPVTSKHSPTTVWRTTSSYSQRGHTWRYSAFATKVTGWSNFIDQGNNTHI